MAYTPSPNYYEPPDEPMFNVQCSNPQCGESIPWEDATKDEFDNWVCSSCQDENYMSPEAIVFSCDLDDDELEERTIVVDVKPFLRSPGFECPSCKNGIINTSIFSRNVVGYDDFGPHHLCVCVECSKVFMVYMRVTIIDLQDKP